MKAWFWATVGVVALSIGLAAGTAAPDPYTAIDLGTLGGSTDVRGLNNAGQVVGYSAAPGDTHAYSWKAGVMTDLGPGGADGVNDAGQVVGASRLFGAGHAFVWSEAGGMTDLGALGGGLSSAIAVNASGQVAGTSETAGGEYHAFLWTPPGTMTDLGTLGGTFSEAFALNDTGQVVGYSQTEFGAYHAFSWKEGVMTDLGIDTLQALAVNASGQVVGDSGPGGHAFSWTQAGGLTDLGTLGGFVSSAQDVSDAGQVVGWSETAAGQSRAFSWTQAGGMVDLGSLDGGCCDSNAYAVNESGQVVGGSSIAADPFANHGFSWTETDGMIDLGTLGSLIVQAVAVNEAGQIAGSGYAPDGVQHAVLWQRESASDTTAPSIDVPADITVDATSASGAAVTYAVSATDDVDGPVAVTCGPPSGSTFPIGTTNVSCTAEDSSDNQATEVFAITVLGPEEQVAGAISYVSGLPLSSSTKTVLAAPLRAMDAALDRGLTRVACVLVRAYPGIVNAMRRAGRLTAAQAAPLLADVAQIGAAAGC